jgi:hypothetical protein
MELAEQLGPYETYEGSPASQGLLQVLLTDYYLYCYVCSIAVA